MPASNSLLAASQAAAAKPNDRARTITNTRMAPSAVFAPLASITARLRQRGGRSAGANAPAKKAVGGTPAGERRADGHQPDQSRPMSAPRAEKKNASKAAPTGNRNTRSAVPPFAFIPVSPLS